MIDFNVLKEGCKLGVLKDCDTDTITEYFEIEKIERDNCDNMIFHLKNYTFKTIVLPAHYPFFTFNYYVPKEVETLWFPEENWEKIKMVINFGRNCGRIELKKDLKKLLSI